MDVFWLVIAIVLMLGGLVGCLLPLLPGPPLSYVALLILQLRSEPPFTTKFLIVWAIVTTVVTLLDYYIPIYGTKKFGGTKYGIWGCAIGLVAGLWLGPIGIITGPFAGAFIGEMIGNNNSDKAFKAALGSFIGFVAGTFLKLVVCLVMAYYFIVTFL
jgi:uncharacterized protein